MSGLKKKIVWNQATLFVYVVLILGLPYLWLSVDLADGQARPFLAIYTMEAVFALGVIVAGKLWLRYAFRQVEKNASETQEPEVSAGENYSARRPDEG